MTEDLRIRSEADLRQIAPLERFWIYGGLIHFADLSGKAFVMMDDDEDRVAVFIEVLRSKDCPVFDEITSMDEYAHRFKSQTS